VLLLFQGAATAAELIPTMQEFKKAQVVKINPDKPQEQARFLTLDVSFFPYIGFKIAYEL